MEGIVYTQSRRRFIATIIVITGVMAIFLYNALAVDPCSVKHPLKPADKAFSGRCHSCGMSRAMAARTWKDFENSKDRFEVCSFTCLARMAVKNGEIPLNVKVALYHDPNTLVAAQNAYFVVGSTAKDTMTQTSKLAFASQQEAEGFVRTCGGEAMGFQKTFNLAKESVNK